MAIKLNQQGKPMDYPEGKDATIKKFTQMILDNAPEYDDFSIRNIAANLNLDKDELRRCQSLSSKIRDSLKESGYCVRYGNNRLKLTHEGREFKNRQPEAKPKLTRYQKIYLPLFVVFGLSTFFFSFLNYHSNKTVDSLKEKYNLLESDFAHYRDSVNESNKETVKTTSKEQSDTSKTKKTDSIN